ncbi:MAG: hypothetical protein H6Q39_1642 [Chloroflexi bacterium]|nr:hypothetical protein [Chloroflexota bacterium]
MNSMPRCKRHPGSETGLSCGKCGDPICPKCLVQTPVGARCPACARVSRVPTYQISRVYYLRAIGAGLGLSIACGLLWGFIQTFLFSSFFNFLIAAAAGYGIGEGISLSVNRKSGLGLCIIGGVAVALSYLIGIFTMGRGHFAPFDILAIGIGIFVAVTRLR